MEADDFGGFFDDGQWAGAEEASGDEDLVEGEGVAAVAVGAGCFGTHGPHEVDCARFAMLVDAA